MKLEFALDLSRTGVRLRHLTAKGDPVIGEVALDDTAFDEKIAGLRQLALDTAEGPLRTELIVPDSEILYTSIDAPGPDRATRDAAVRAALESMTPYGIADLRYDWRTKDDAALVAAVAKETLDEAEGFAAAHGFNPVRFTARPRPGMFRGRPKFGATSSAEAPATPPADATVATAAPTVAPTEVAPTEPPTPQASTPDAPETAARPPEPSSEAASPPEASEDHLDAPAQTPAERPHDPAEAKPASEIEPREPGMPAPKEPAAPRPAPATKDTAPLPEAPVQFMSRRRTAEEEPAATSPDLGDVPGRLDLRADAGEADVDAQDAPAPRTSPAATGKMGQTSSAPSIPGPDPAQDRLAANRPKDEAEALTIFGARASERPASRGIGGLVAGVVIAVALVVGGWIGITWVTGSASEDANSIAAVEPGTTAPDAEARDVVPPGPDGGATPPATDEAALTPAADAEATVPPSSDAAAEPALPQPLTPEAALSRYASTGIWQLSPEESAPPEADRAEDIYVSADDPEIALASANRMPTPEPPRDTPSDTVAMPPAPAGTDFDLTDDGMVRPDPEGAVSPDGIVVYDGVPDVIPPDRPDRAPVEVRSANDTEVPAVRPLRRPGKDTGSEEEAEAQTPDADESTTDDEAQAALLRPRARPEDLAAARESANAAAEASAAASTAAQEVIDELEDNAPADAADTAEQDESAAEEEETEIVSTNPAAVARSLSPRSRPEALEQRIAAARASTPVPSEARAQPTAPTSATVARSATSPNELRLGRMNLIGVYGGDSNRRALLRLPNGRFVKVKVGDRIDGGRVAAIDDSALRYVKGGRNITLQMPNS